MFFSSESFLCDSDAEVAVALASGPLCSVTLMRFLRFEVLPVSGTGESLILSHRKDLEDGSEEGSNEITGYTSALHG